MKKVYSLFFLTMIVCTSCSTGFKGLVYNELPKSNDSLEINEKLLSQHAQRIRYKRGGKTACVIDLAEPVMVVMAEKEEEWGYFQFPIVGKANDGTLIVSWQMKLDSHVAYGRDSGRECLPMMSKDGGLNWTQQDKNYDIISNGYNVVLDNGAILEVNTPPSKNIHSFDSFPKAVKTKGSSAFFKMNTLPEELQGVYLQYRYSNNNKKTIHAKLNDPHLLRYSIDDMMPVVWWGSIKQLSDKSLVAGVYPGLYLDSKGDVNNGVVFYRSSDYGQTWDIQGKILFNKTEINSVRGENGFGEPVFEVLRDSAFICVMRTGSMTPMYSSFSYDRGLTWTLPMPFASNGVKPRLLLLNNGVLVLASGRPGIQLRFSLDGKGHDWTDAIDMIPLAKKNDAYVRDISCGYASIIEADDNSFYLVYSDFTTKNEKGEIRKSIWFRKVTVKRK